MQSLTEVFPHLVTSTFFQNYCGALYSVGVCTAAVGEGRAHLIHDLRIRWIAILVRLEEMIVYS